MRRISSRMTFYYKRVFPVIWFAMGFLLLVAQFIVPATVHWESSGPFFVVVIIMIVVGYLMMRKYAFDLVDEALDAGDALVIRNGHQEDRILLSNIINVNYTPLLQPPRVTLSLRHASIFGKDVTFCAPMTLFGLSNSPVIDELIERIDAKRHGR